MAIDIESFILDLVKQIILNQLQQATSAQVSGVSSFAQQVANEQLARDLQSYQLETAIFQKLGQMDADLSNLISLTQQTGKPVTLPSRPPAGYGGPAPSDVATAVWDFASPTYGQQMIQVQDESFRVHQNMSATYAAFPTDFRKPGWWVAANWLSALPPSDSSFLPTVDYTTILPTDATPSDWLNRVYPGLFFTAGQDGRPFTSDPTADAFWFLELPQWEFDALKTQLQPLAVAGAPVWPGLAKVHLGAPVAFAGTFTVAGPMHGIIVDITSVAPRFGLFNYGGMPSYRNIGSFTFTDDRGEAEHYTALGFIHGVYAPRTMVEAASALFRADPSVVGTVTPWTIV